MLKVQFTPSGEKDLKLLPRDIRERVVRKITFFSSQENPLTFAKPLVNLPPANAPVQSWGLSSCFLCSIRSDACSQD